MRGRPLLGAAVVVLALAGFAWWALDRESAGDSAGSDLAVPGLAERVEAIDRIEVLGAGDASLVVLEKREGVWSMPSRGDWPGNQREIGNALHRLGAAKRIEAKTADPGKHARLGVEDVSAAAAKGTELRLSGGGEPLVVVIGQNHPALGGSYLRIGDDPQAWLIDEDVAPQREPGAWLDRRLLDLPLARIERIRVTPVHGAAYVLARVDDVFTPDGVAPASLADPDDGNAAAGFTDQLSLDDVAADDGHAAASTLVFESVDGIALTVAAWQDEQGAWARLSASLDEAAARAWFERAETAPVADVSAAVDTDTDTDTEADADAPADVDTRVAELRTQVDAWQPRFAGRRFLLPAHKAQHLLKSRADYLGESP